MRYDIKPALQQAVNGALQNLGTDYEQRIKTFKNLASPQTDVKRVADDIEKVTVDLKTDKQFLTQGVMKAQKTYTKNVKPQTHKKNIVMEL